MSTNLRSVGWMAGLFGLATLAAACGSTEANRLTSSAEPAPPSTLAMAAPEPSSPTTAAVDPCSLIDPAHLAEPLAEAFALSGSFELTGAGCQLGWASINETPGATDEIVESLIQWDGARWQRRVTYPSTLCVGDAVALGVPPEFIVEPAWMCIGDTPATAPTTTVPPAPAPPTTVAKIGTFEQGICPLGENLVYGGSTATVEISICRTAADLLTYRSRSLADGSSFAINACERSVEEYEALDTATGTFYGVVGMLQHGIDPVLTITRGDGTVVKETLSDWGSARVSGIGTCWIPVD